MSIFPGGLNIKCYPEFFSNQICPIDQIIINIYERFLLQAFRFAGFLCISPKWVQRNDQLAAEICTLIYHFSNELYKILKKFANVSKNSIHPLTFNNLLYICAGSFQTLWTDGPHKVVVRINERKAIKKFYCELIVRSYNRMRDGSSIVIPNRLHGPFKKILI